MMIRRFARVRCSHVGPVVLAVMVVLAGACSSSEGATTTAPSSTVVDAASAASPTSVAPNSTAAVDIAATTPVPTNQPTVEDTTTTAVPTTAAPTTTTSDPGPKPTTTKPPTAAKAPTTTVIDTNLLAGGSGCTPGTSQHLPDGVWYGDFVSATSWHLEFDLACWFYGDAATLAAAEDGEESPPSNDYYVRNGNPLVRTLSVGDGAIVRWMPENGVAALVEAESFETWLAARAAMPFPELRPSIWVTLSENTILEIEEQFVP